MTILSDEDIKREIGEKLYITPFKLANLKGASYNLTASKLAWSLESKKSIYDNESEKIIIPAATTALIETLEVIWVSQKICGSYHSKVLQVSQGTGHIGTTLDPNYIGLSLIAVHNHSPNPIELIPEKDTFVTIVFQYLGTKSSRELHGNSAGRIEILEEVGISLTREERQILQKDYIFNPISLKTEMEKCEDYQTIHTAQQKEGLNSFFKNAYLCLSIIPIIYLIGLAIIVTASYMADFFYWLKTTLISEPWYNSAKDSAGQTLRVIFTAFVSMVVLHKTLLVNKFGSFNSLKTDEAKNNKTK